MRFLLLTLLVVGITSLSAQDKFVKVKDGGFTIEGKPYHFIGANMWYGCYLGSSKVPGGRERLIRELDFLQKEGITNLRVLGASESSLFPNHFPFTIQTAPAQYDEEVLEGLDFLLAEMGKRNMKAVVYLNNYWNWSGGMGQYLTWSDPDLAASVPFNPERKWEKEMALSTYFYSNEDAQKNFRLYITNLINRKNKFTSTSYKDDPTIMAWQLCNEPRPGMDGEHGESNISPFMQWIDGTAAYIHSLDKNHLVSSGSEGKMGAIQNLAYYEQSHASKHIDYLTLHIWAKNWQWFDAERPAATIERSKRNAVEYLNIHAELATKMNKPLVIEEFGLDRDNKSLKPGSAAKLRDAYFETLFRSMLLQMKAGKTIAGANFWAWGGEGSPMTEIKVENVNAATYVGDPFVEPQGLNSVFAADKRTLKIIRKYNRKFNSLD
ncbi:MAG: mannanase [Cytophagia bacterium]|nr:mannanase [Cytophagia bacterium]